MTIGRKVSLSEDVEITALVSEQIITTTQFLSIGISQNSRVIFPGNMCNGTCCGENEKIAAVPVARYHPRPRLTIWKHPAVIKEKACIGW